MQVALLFLTRDWLPYEPVWRAFLGSVPSMGGAQQEQEAAWKLLFSLYVHAPPANKWGWDSIFAGREVAGRITVQWGQWSVVRPSSLNPPHHCPCVPIMHHGCAVIILRCFVHCMYKYTTKANMAHSSGRHVCSVLLQPSWCNALHCYVRVPSQG